MSRHEIMAAFWGGAVSTLLLMTVLYRWLTAERRRTMREIRRQSEARGWSFKIRQWMGNPSAFRIEGRTASGLAWVAKTESAGESDRGWTQKLAFHFRELAGATDFALMPRGKDDLNLKVMATNVSPVWRERIARWSGAFGGAIGFVEKHAEAPAGWPPFDAAYCVLVKPGQNGPVDSRLARQIVEWPAGAVAAKEVAAWRGPFGFHFEVRLPDLANWATVEHAASLVEEMVKRLPPAEPTPAPSGFVDKMIGKMQ